MSNERNCHGNSNWKCCPEKGYKICQSGSHIDGNFIRVFVPDTPYYDEEGKLKLITYLHGFALCKPEFYEAHLEELARKGYYIFFPDFQKSDYPDELEKKKVYKYQSPTYHLSFWVSQLIKSITNQEKLDERFFNSAEKKSAQIPQITGKLKQPEKSSYFRVSLGLVIFY
ncbi:hypothetical protein B6N60_01982 [Richelia sinica FACHB-800]|uniref:Alpha/beta hydrolase n=1 Tax=Richelia sinica FACHB-800 TaxID=1357546 RepID=A0A975Y4L4_9NOST|nr:hypothetical protein [Richelia sinica]QXE23292.1 hypothetical protein B6N60_01982 [Richelia sinica FACHB-800]